MGTGKLHDMSADAISEGPQLKLKFLAYKVGSTPDAISARVSKNLATGRDELYLTPTEAARLTREYGCMPSVKGVKLIIQEERPVQVVVALPKPVSAPSKSGAEPANGSLKKPPMPSASASPPIVHPIAHVSDSSIVYGLLDELKNPASRESAIAKLVGMGKIAIQSLISASHNPSRRDDAFAVLVRIGTPAVPRLVSELSNSQTRSQVIDALFEICITNESAKELIVISCMNF